MRRWVLAGLLCWLPACSSTLLTLKVTPTQLLHSAEVHAVARYYGSVPADRIVWRVCNYTSSASVESTDRTFEAFFPCRLGGVPTVTLYSGSQVVASMTGSPITVGVGE